MAETLLISDLHLSPERPATVGLFTRFLARRAPQAARLYILGDLFDAWVGDDDDTPPYPDVRDALRRLTSSGTECLLMRGNRDFLLGKRFCRETGCRLIGDPTLVRFDDRQTLLTHGDLLCTDDVAYQRFRRRVRNPFVTRLFLLKSLAKRRAIAEDYRRKSGAATAEKTARIMDVNQDTVRRYLDRYDAGLLIHGHTHRPADHELTVGGRPARRSVLAEWHETHGEALVHSRGEWHREAVHPG